MSSPLLPNNETAPLKRKQAYETPSCDEFYRVNQTIPCYVRDSSHPVMVKNEIAKLKSGAIGIGVMVGLPVLAAIVTGIAFGIVDCFGLGSDSDESDDSESIGA
jgi:hypothetical protein